MAGPDADSRQSAPAPAGRAPTPLWRRRPIQLTAAAVLVAAGIGGYIAATSGPAQIHVRGTLTLGVLSATPTGPSGHATDGEPCVADQGYDDITAGASVTIGGSTGQTLGVGALSSGVQADVDDTLGVPAGDCVFSFDVAVPGGQSAYTVTISHRGTQSFTPQQVAAGIKLTLGR